VPQASFRQRSFLSPEFADPACLVDGELPWLLFHFGHALFPAWLFDGWNGLGRRGRNAWPAHVLMAMLLLRWEEEGMSRRAAARRAKHHTQWRAAMSLQIGSDTPSERTLRRFEKFLRARDPKTGVPRHLLFHEHVVRLCLDAGVASKPIWATDSTPMWAYGAVFDTVELLGDGVRTLAMRWAKITGASMAAMSRRWNAAWIIAKSIKGAFSIEWSDENERANVVDALAQAAVHAVREIRRRLDEVDTEHRQWLLQRCAHVLRVVENDLETDKNGRLIIAERVAKDRLISLTDPMARHGRKTQSKTFDGFKLHLVGDVVSGLIASLTVTPGNVHDNVPAHRLFARAKRLHTAIAEILGDTAYGSAELRHTSRKDLGLKIIAPPPPVSVDEGRLSRADFKVDFEANDVTCPAGHQATSSYTTWSTAAQAHLPVFKWSVELCSTCPLRAQCRGEQKGGHRLILHSFEKELRAARETWADPATRQAYRARSQCERLVNQLVRHGARNARAWGIQAAHLQGHLIAARCNLGLLARRLAQERSQTIRAAA